MELTTSKKKIMLAAILTSGLALVISQSALAESAQAPQANRADVQKNIGKGPGQYSLDPAIQKARDKFLSETVAMRKEMAEKHAVMRALLNADTPDTTKISQLAGELFELREKLRLKAQETGLPMHMLMMGDMSCQGTGMGMGMGMGMGGGRHHMK
jgi:zinc resistance-associated protein